MGSLNFIKKLLCSVFFLQTWLGVCAQNSSDQHVVRIYIKPVKMISIQSDGDITLELSPPDNAGNNLGPLAVSDTFWINYTYLGQEPGMIVTQLMQDNLPSGLNFSVLSHQSSSGTIKVSLSSQPQQLYTQLKSGYSGKGKGKGIPCHYELSLDEDTELEDSIENAVVIYTILDI